jgi:hypothetical protein
MQPMATYEGLRAIAARMGWKSPSTAIIAHLRDNFPMYLKRGKGTKLNWVSNDNLIFCWEVQECRRTRQVYRKGHRRQQRQRKRQNETAELDGKSDAGK